jgi:glycosyltransferase involved in cell wall biosynthesis
MAWLGTGLDVETAMLALPGGLRRSLIDKYLAGSAALTNRMLRGRSGGRDFSRVVVVAALGRQNGVTSGAKLQWEALRQLGIDAELLDATRALRNSLFRVTHRPGSAYIFHSGGPQTASLIASVLPHAACAYRVAYWAWELPDPPQDWAGCDRNVAEIWTPSGFSKASLGRLVSRPVLVAPHHIASRTARSRRSDGPFTVLAMADSRSSLSRKNPEGAAKAFRLAFGTSRSARLVVKLSGRDDEVGAVGRSLGELLQGCNAQIMKARLDDAGMIELYRGTDVLLSLHRAEGFGLPMREAMAHGIPVVATGWSGNCEFMDASNSRLVPYTIVPVRDQSAIYDGSCWAEPDVEAAAEALRRLAADRGHYARLAAAAHASVAAASPRFPFDVAEVRRPAQPAS